ncbi:DUF928 domain-containing protein [Mucilaginibacter sp.]
MVHSNPFTLGPGVNSIPGTAIPGSGVVFYQNQVGVITRHTRSFPVGDYEYCFTLDFPGAVKDPTAQQCFDYSLVPFAPLHLIEPYDRDTICDKRPMLTWQPLIPYLAGSSYQLVLSEIKPGQNAIEALNYNLPIINQSDIQSPVLVYPTIDNPLEEGKTYAWQVTAYLDQSILNRSEIWSFKVHCTDTVKKQVIANDGYRDILDLVRGNYYVAVTALKFALTNSYSPGPFKYEIVSLNNPDKKIKHLPKVNITTGQNKVLIDLSGTDSFDDGSSYMMKCWLPDGTIKYLRFIYKD